MSTGKRVNLSRFITVAEHLDDAFAAAAPVPDYLVHECELAEAALSRLRASRGVTSDSILAQVFGLSRV